MKKKKESTDFESEIIGSIQETYLFRNPFDFQTDFSKHKPLQYLDEAKERYDEIKKMVTTETTEIDSFDEFDFAFQSPLPKKLVDYGYKNHGVRYTLREDGTIGLESKKTLRRKFSPISVHYGFGSEIPYHPIPICIDPDLEKSIEEIISEYPSAFTSIEIEIIKKLIDLFNPGETIHPYSGRLIWPIHTITLFFPVKYQELVIKLLPAVSYTMKGGAWRRSAIKIGYNPMTDARAR